MENKIIEEDKSNKPTPFLKRVNDLEKKVQALEIKLSTIIKALRG